MESSLTAMPPSRSPAQSKQHGRGHGEGVLFTVPTGLSQANDTDKLQENKQEIHLHQSPLIHLLGAREQLGG